MAQPAFQINPVLYPTTPFLYALDEVFYAIASSSGGSVITNWTSGFTLPVTQSIDDLVTLAGIELVKFTHRTTGRSMVVNRSRVSRVKQDDAGLATIVMETEVSFPATETFIVLRPLFQALPAGGGGSNTNIYNSDDSIIDSTRVVTVGGSDLFFTTTGTGTVVIGLSAAARVEFDPDNNVVKAYGMDVEVDDNTKGVVVKSTGGSRFRFRPNEIGVWQSTSL